MAYQENLASLHGEIMLDFYYQVGYSGLFLLLIGIVGLFMAIRGTVLVLLIKKQGLTPNSIQNQIIITVQQCERSESQQTESKDSPEFTNLTTPSSAPSRELIINTLMQVKMKGIPLLGLLGTVLGMVDVFSNLSAQTMPDPSMLAGGIWEALLTTVMGLTLAIPALIVHYFLLMNLRAMRNQINLAVSNIKLN